MILKTIKTSLFAIAIISSVGLCAQNLNVLQKGGSQTRIAIHNIKTLTFLQGNVNINLKAGPPLSFSLSDIRNINFTPTTDIQLPEFSKTENIHLFPNPANNYIKIILNSLVGADVELKITSLDGRIVYMQKLNSGENDQHTINVSSWANGIYYLFIQDGKNISSKKFLKTN